MTILERPFPNRSSRGIRWNKTSESADPNHDYDNHEVDWSRLQGLSWPRKNLLEILAMDHVVNPGMMIWERRIFKTRKYGFIYSQMPLPRPLHSKWLQRGGMTPLISLRMRQNSKINLANEGLGFIEDFFASWQPKKDLTIRPEEILHVRIVKIGKVGKTEDY